MSDFRWSIFRQYSHPNGNADDRLFSLVAETHANGAVGSALSEIPDGTPFGASATGLLNKWLKRQKSLPEVWHTSISKVGRYQFDFYPDTFGERLGRLLLDIAPQIEDFSLSYGAVSRAPTIMSSIAFVPSGSVTVTKAHGQLSLDQPGLGSIAFSIDSKTLKPLSNNLTDSISICELLGMRIVQTNQTADQICVESQYGLPLDWSKIGEFGRDSVLHDGLRLLDSVAPEYLRWVTRVVNTVVVIPPMEDRCCSGSWADSSGSIYISEPSSAMESAEILVHEASHQYFHMAERVSKIHNLDDSKLFYSPPVGKNRSLDRILIAYHAFANILILYVHQLDVGKLDTRSWNRFRKIKENVSALESHLNTTDGLTELGLAIFIPLRDALHDRLHDADIRY